MQYTKANTAHSDFDLNGCCKDKILELLETDQDGQSNQWLETIHFELLPESQCLIVFFPHLFLAQWFESYIKAQFQQAISHDIKCIKQIICKTSTTNLQKIFPKHQINNNYCFTNFIYNDENYIAYKSAYNLATNNEIIGNPFVIFGNKGSGKTHLATSIANLFIINNLDKNLLLISISDLNNAFKYKFKDKTKIKDYILNFDFIIIEDINLFFYYNYLQNYIIHIFDTFYEFNKQIVFTCTGNLSAMDFLEPKLKSRLESGLLVNLNNPDLNTRLRYIEQQCQIKQLQLNSEQILCLAIKYNNFKDLYRIIIHLLSQVHFKNQDLTQLDQDQFEDILPAGITDQPQTIQLDSEQVIALVSDYFQLSPNQLKAAKRDKASVLARQIAMYLCRELLEQTYTQIGAVFGGKDHSTVLYSCKKIQTLQYNNNEIKNMLKTLQLDCKQIGIKA